MLQILQFLIDNTGNALHMAYTVVLIGLFAIAIIRYKFMKSALWSTIFQVVVGGGFFLLGIWLGNLGLGE